MKILLATDGSACAQEAGTLLAALELPPETELLVLTVASDTASWSEIFAGRLVGDASLVQELEAEEKERIERILEATAAPFRERGLDVRTAFRRGHPGNEILQAAAEMGAQLVVLGSHGRTGLSAVLIGSTAEYVAKRAHCSVLVARAYTGIRRIMLATDGSENSHRAMERIAELPLPRTAGVTVLHVTQSFYAFPGLLPTMREEFERTVQEIRRAQRENAELLVEGTRRYLEGAGYSVVPVVLTGDPAEEILAAAQAEGTDLIVTGARGLSPPRQFLLGSVSGRVLRYARCSVLLAR